ncbi:hypothetical protein J2858_000911 [Neorhizobium galegae]|nr:hypothetical protein [Neorhizobium galegae]
MQADIIEWQPPPHHEGVPRNESRNGVARDKIVEPGWHF